MPALTLNFNLLNQWDVYLMQKKKNIAIIIILSGLQLIYQEINICFYEHIKQMVPIVEIIPQKYI